MPCWCGWSEDRRLDDKHSGASARGLCVTTAPSQHPRRVGGCARSPPAAPLEGERISACRAHVPGGAAAAGLSPPRGGGPPHALTWGTRLPGLPPPYHLIYFRFRSCYCESQGASPDPRAPPRAAAASRAAGRRGEGGRGEGGPLYSCYGRGFLRSQ